MNRKEGYLPNSYPHCLLQETGSQAGSLEINLTFTPIIYMWWCKKVNICSDRAKESVIIARIRHQFIR